SQECLRARRFTPPHWALARGKMGGGQSAQATHGPRRNRSSGNRCNRHWPHCCARAHGRTRVLRGEHAHRFPGRPTQIRAGPARRVAAAAEPPPRPAAASKKPQKTARSHQRRREPGGTDAVWWREVRADDWGARGYGERDYGRGGYAREGAFGLGYSERDYGRGGYAREGAFGFFRGGRYSLAVFLCSAPSL